MLIGITDPMRDDQTRQNYVEWIRRFLPNPEVVILSPANEKNGSLRRCDGLVLTGGNDVHPKFYHHPEALGLVQNVSEERDWFEFGLIHEALERRIPMLGVCRGSQIFNVAMGGTLVPDVEKAGHESHSRLADGGDRTHPVDIEPGSMLHDIVGEYDGMVNSSHHQSVGEPGRNLWVTGRSPDGVAEAIEWIEPAGRSSIVMVQWHPERMKDFSSPFCSRLVDEFARAIRDHKNVEENS